MHQRLREKGWTEHEIAHLQQHYTPKKETRGVLLVGLLLLGLAAVGIPYAYGLLGRVLTESIFQVMLAFIGVPLGASFALLLVDFELLEKHHHISLLILTPLVIVIAASWGFRHINAAAPEGAFTHNALIGAVVYAISFVVPYIAMVVYEWNSKTGQ